MPAVQHTNWYLMLSYQTIISKL